MVILWIMNNRSARYSVLGVLTALTLSASAAADPATNIPAQASPSDAPPSMVAPSESPSGVQPTSPREPAPPDRPTAYTVISGDTLWGLSHKFNTSIRELKKINHLKKSNLKPGQVLKIPPSKGSSEPAKKTTTISHSAKSIVTHASPYTQPVQAFDLAAATFPSCPVPSAADGTEGPTVAHVKAAIVSKRVVVVQPTYRIPSGPMDLEETQEELAVGPSSATPAAPANGSSKALGLPGRLPAIADSTSAIISAPKTADRGFFNFFYTPPPSVDWGARFTQVARDLGARDLDYNDDWRPPGESHSWTMDCSNTARYLYKVTTGIQLPRTASDQYYCLHLQKKAWDVPQTANGFADCNYLRKNLRAGDLLFWENTYKPDRQPPITHVMVYLGTNARGQWMMAGSQSTRGGEHNHRHGGPDIYVFNPTRPCGGYSTWLGLVHHTGRFCAYGRPLEADKSKLAVASND